MRRPLVAGNWKLNGSRAENTRLITGMMAQLDNEPACEVVVCPPFVYLDQVGGMLVDSCIELGAQNLSAEASGAYTGEVSAAMLSDAGCRYVIIGHSERRALYGETDELIALKFLAAHGAGLSPILCVGESLQERQEGVTKAVISRQINAVLDQIDIQMLASGLVAYEPVWAIGTGQTASVEQAQEVHAHIRSIVSTHDAKIAGELRILYGGSVKGSNAGDLFAMEDIDGGLIGGASLDPVDFAAICSST